MNQLACPDSQPIFLNAFDPSIAPPLLFYAYIPIILISLLMGIAVVRKDRGSLTSKLFFFISLSFVFWIVNVIVQWIAVYAHTVHFAWQLTALFEVLIFTLSVYFVDVFAGKRDSSFGTKVILSSVILGIFALLPTKLNIAAFDLTNCEGVVGPLWHFMYPFEIVTILWILYVGIRAAFNKKMARNDRNQVKLLTIGMAIFMSIFATSNIWGEIAQTYEINLIGPIGMILFLGFLTYLIVRYRTFNIKMIATQALMLSLIALIGSQFFFIRNNTNRILTGITLVMTVFFGALLVRSVEREIAQKEKIKRLASSLADTNKELEAANEKLKELDLQKTEFVSLASHQLRSPLTAIKGYSSMILEGDYGKLTGKMKEAVARIFESSQKLVLVIEDFLNITRIELGRIKYDMTEWNLNDLVKNVIGEQKPNIERRGLTVAYEEAGAPNIVYADQGKVSQVISNLIDNAVKYTKQGDIAIKVENEPRQKCVRVTVKDTGVGIEAKTLPHLFQKFSRAEDASQTNIIGTGLGLYVAKQIIDAHQGKIWAESDGKGKGSTFFVELALSTGVAPTPIIAPPETELIKQS